MSERDYLKKYIRELVNEVEEELEESTATGAVDGYQTPHAFSSKKHNQRRKKTATQAGYTIVDGDVENITEGKIPQPIQNLIGDMVKNKVQARTVTIKNPTAHKRFMKDVKPAVDAKLLMIKHNPINKDEMKISLGPKAQDMMFGESVNEEGTYKHPHQLRSNYPKSKMPDSFDIEFKDAMDADPFLKDRFFYISGFEVRRMTPGGPMKNPILKLKKTDKVGDVVKKLKQTWYKVKESVNEGERVYIDYLNKDKRHQRDRKYFKSYADAVKWAKKEFEKFNPDMIHYESVNEGRTPKKEVRRNRWLELKNDETKPNKKLSLGLKELKYKLSEIEKFLSWYNKISKMNELSSDSYWKRTHRHIYKIKERLVNIAHTIKELEK
jgi:hypothetical protein